MTEAVWQSDHEDALRGRVPGFNAQRSTCFFSDLEQITNLCLSFLSCITWEVIVNTT